MITLSIRLPESLLMRIKEVARRDNVSINQMITIAVAEKLAVLETEDCLGKGASRSSRNRFNRALNRVPNRKPASQDRIIEPF